MNRDYLKIQGQRDYERDLKALLMGGIDCFLKLNILDIGCNNGEVTLRLMNRFKPDVCRFQYTGVDFDETVIEEASLTHSDDCLFIAGDIYEHEVMEKVVSRGPFNVIVLFQVIMHVKDPVKLLMLLKPLLSNDGFLYIKVVEDGMKMCHPGEDTLKQIIDLFQKYCDMSSRYVDGAHTDRFCGHKTYGYLVEAGYEDIEHYIAHTDTVGKDHDELMEEFLQFSQFRLKDDMDEDMYTEMASLLREMKRLFTTKGFYYSTPTMYFVAGK